MPSTHRPSTPAEAAEATDVLRHWSADEFTATGGQYLITLSDGRTVVVTFDTLEYA